MIVFLNVVKWSLCALLIVFCLLFALAHQGGVTVVLFVLEMEWVLSTGQDKSFTWHCSESGQQLGTYRTTAWVSGLQYPFLHHYTFHNTCQFITTEWWNFVAVLQKVVHGQFMLWYQVMFNTDFILVINGIFIIKLKSWVILDSLCKIWCWDQTCLRGRSFWASDNPKAGTGQLQPGHHI